MSDAHTLGDAQVSTHVPAPAWGAQTRIYNWRLGQFIPHGFPTNPASQAVRPCALPEKEGGEMAAPIT